MSGRKVICQWCRERFVKKKDNFVQVSAGHFHPECYEEREREKLERQDILQYITSLLGEVNMGQVNKQIRLYTDRYGYKISGIKGTLYYISEVKRIQMDPKYGIGLVAHFYKEAASYFEKMERMSSIKPYEKKENRIVTIEEPRAERVSRVVDLEELFDEEDFN